MLAYRPYAFIFSNDSKQSQAIVQQLDTWCTPNIDMI